MPRKEAAFSRELRWGWLLPVPSSLDVPRSAWLERYLGPSRAVSVYSAEVPLPYLRLKSFPKNAIHGQIFF